MGIEGPMPAPEKKRIDPWAPPGEQEEEIEVIPTEEKEEIKETTDSQKSE